jgi:hypothetical protein
MEYQDINTLFRGFIRFMVIQKEQKCGSVPIESEIKKKKQKKKRLQRCNEEEEEDERTHHEDSSLAQGLILAIVKMMIGTAPSFLQSFPGKVQKRSIELDWLLLNDGGRHHGGDSPGGIRPILQGGLAFDPLLVRGVHLMCM